jgi:hypothetical protein
VVTELDHAAELMVKKEIWSFAGICLTWRAVHCGACARLAAGKGRLGGNYPIDRETMIA